MGAAMMIALVLALAFSARRLFLRASLRRSQATASGGSPDTAIEVERYDDMDSELASRRCLCGGKLKILGEGTAEVGERSVRVVRTECDRCEELGWVYFDVSAVEQAPTMH